MNTDDTKIIFPSFLSNRSTFLVHHHREEARARQGRLITRTAIILTTRKSSFSNHQYGLGRVSTRIGARRERHAKVFTETKQTERFERMRTQLNPEKLEETAKKYSRSKKDKNAPEWRPYATPYLLREHWRYQVCQKVEYR